jgi:hypothetical protein
MYYVCSVHDPQPQISGPADFFPAALVGARVRCTLLAQGSSFFQGQRKVPKAGSPGASPSSATGGSVKAEGLGDGLTQGKAAIANPPASSGEALRLTLPPGLPDDFASTLLFLSHD